MGFRDLIAYLLVRVSAKSYIPWPIRKRAILIALHLSPVLRELWLIIHIITLRWLIREFIRRSMVKIKKRLNGDYLMCPICGEVFTDTEKGREMAYKHALLAHGQPVKMLLLATYGTFSLTPEEVKRGEPFPWLKK